MVFECSMDASRSFGRLFDFKRVVVDKRIFRTCIDDYFAMIGPGSPVIPQGRNGPVFNFDNSNAGEYVSTRAPFARR